MYSRHKSGINRWKQETVDSCVICYPLSLHMHERERERREREEREKRERVWRQDQDLILARSCSNGEMMFPVCVEGKLGPSQNLHIHHDYCCHLLCSLMSSNNNRSPSVCSVDVSFFFISISGFPAVENLPRCVRAASHLSFRDHSNQPKVTW